MGRPADKSKKSSPQNEDLKRTSEKITDDAGVSKNPTGAIKNPLGHFDTTGNAAEIVGRETGVSPATVKRDGKFAEAVEKLPVNAVLARTHRLL